MLGLYAALVAGGVAAIPPGMGLGLPAGIAIAVALTTVGAMGNAPGLATDHERWLPACAALAAALGHWTELQFGFETPAPALLAWACLGMLLSPTRQDACPRQTDEPLEGSHSGPPLHDARGTETRFWPSAMLAVGAMLVAISMGAGATALDSIGWLLGAIWLSCGGLIMIWEGRSAIVYYPILSLTPVLVVWIAGRLLGPNSLAQTIVAWGCLLGGAMMAGWMLHIPAPGGQTHRHVLSIAEGSAPTSRGQAKTPGASGSVEQLPTAR